MRFSASVSTANSVTGQACQPLIATTGRHYRPSLPATTTGRHYRPPLPAATAVAHIAAVPMDRPSMSSGPLWSIQCGRGKHNDGLTALDGGLTVIAGAIMLRGRLFFYFCRAGLCRFFESPLPLF